MTDKNDVVSCNLSRRSLLLRGVACAATASMIVAIGVNESRAAQLPQKAVNYRSSPKGDQRCGTCSLFVKPHSCKSVAGTISPNGWCSLYRKA